MTQDDVLNEWLNIPDDKLPCRTYAEYNDMRKYKTQDEILNSAMANHQDKDAANGKK